MVERARQLNAQRRVEQGLAEMVGLVRGIIADGRVSLFSNYPSPLVTDLWRRPDGTIDRANVARDLGLCNDGSRHRVKTGKSETFKYYDLSQISGKWLRGRGRSRNWSSSQRS